jgi:hypothetical protein
MRVIGESTIHDVFVSYSQVDKTVADAVVAGLEGDGIRCWVAPRDILPGTSWGDAIVEAIAASTAMALILSANSNASRQVIREVERAVANGVVIVPFRIDETDPTGAMAYFLGTEHWLDALTPPMQRHIGRLSSAIKSLLSGEVRPGGLDQPPPSLGARRRGLRSWTWLAATVVVALTVVGATVLFSGSGDSPGSTVVATTGPAAADQPMTSVTKAPTTTTTTGVPLLEEVGSYRTSYSVTGIDIDGTFLAMANGGNGLMYMSVANAGEPRPIAEYAAGGAEEVVLDGGYAYLLVGEFSKSLLIIDIDAGGGFGLSGEEGQELGSDSLYNLAKQGDFLFIGGHSYVGVVYVADPTSPILLFEWVPPGNTGNPATVHVSGDLGLFGAGWEGLYTFDLTDPARPVELSGFDTPDWVIDVDEAGGVAFLTLGESGLAAVDVSDPTRPLLISRIDLPGFASPLALADGMAFIGLADENLSGATVAIVDVSDPQDMRVVGTFGAYEGVGDVEVSNGHLFVTDTGRGLFVYRIVGP